MSGKSRGFTLIELMVVAAIVAVLAAIGYPTYLNHVRKTARAEAKVRLLQVAQLQERYFTEQNSYTTNIAGLWALPAPSIRAVPTMRAASTRSPRRPAPRASSPRPTRSRRCPKEARPAIRIA